MITLYIGKKNLPDDKIFIEDVEDLILVAKICGTEFQRRVLKEVEHGKYYDSIRYIDRFETLLYYIEMSIGSKAPLAAEYYNDRIINFSECGENALRMLSYLNDGNVYLRSRFIELPWEIDHPIVCNGKKWERVSLLNRLIG